MKYKYFCSNYCFSTFNRGSLCDCRDYLRVSESKGELLTESLRLEDNKFYKRYFSLGIPDYFHEIPEEEVSSFMMLKELRR